MFNLNTSAIRSLTFDVNIYVSYRVTYVIFDINIHFSNYRVTISDVDETVKLANH